MPAASPLIGSEGVVRLSIKSAGQVLAETVLIVSVQVQRAVNKVPSARLVIADGDMAAATWTVSDGKDFVPGSAISISAGYGDKETPIFEGIVVKAGIQVSGSNYSRLVVECRDKAVRTTVGRKSANFIDQTDSALMQKLLGEHGLEATIATTTTTHKEMVQYQCSDWDFIVSRAEVNGLLVICNDGKLSIQAPDPSAAAVLTATYGQDIVEFQAEVDARSQWQQVSAFGWDPQTQTVLQSQAAVDTAMKTQGDLASGTLADVLGLAQLRLQTPSPLENASLQAWAKAQQMRAGLARVRGRVKFQGHAAVRPGTMIELAGVGKRYNGKAFVAAVLHEIHDGNWFSEVEFGLAPEWFADQQRDVVTPPASGWLPGAEGLQIGKVLKLDGDPAGQNRIQIDLPLLQTETRGVWARLAQFHASSGFGAFFLPEVDDEVIVGFFNHDPSHPVVLGSLYSGPRKPPYVLTAENDTKAIVTRCLAKIEINDADKVITITTPGKNKLVLSDKDKSILMQDQNDNKVELAPGGITIESPKDIKISAQGTITIDAVGKIGITSKADVATQGLNVSCKANVGFSAQGSATAELSAAGQTTVKGAMVMIN